MSQREIELIDELCQLRSENNWLEFKENNFNPETIGKLCSALSNSARLENKDIAYILWGVRDGDHKIIGTQVSPSNEKVGNQVFEFWLNQRLPPRINLSFKEVNHPEGRILLLEIPAASIAPVEFNGTSYIRIGSATPKLSEYPDRFQNLLLNIRPYSWETDIAMSYLSEDDVLSLLDYPSYFTLTEQNLPDNRKGIFEHLAADNLIKKDVASKWNITNLGAILIARDLNKFDLSISRKAVRFVNYKGTNKASTVIHRLDGQKGYASGFEGLVNFINNLLPINEHIGSVFRQEHKLYPERSLRELIANALIHQDMTITGTGPRIELYNDRIEITNPGSSLIGVDRIFDLPPRSRNQALASIMRRMRFCEEEGSGLDKVLIDVEIFQLPAPKFVDTGDAFQVILYGPRTFANMTQPERIRACEQHAIIKYLNNERMKNASLCERFGIDKKNAAQATNVINAALAANKIKPADPEHPRAGYIPSWA